MSQKELNTVAIPNIQYECLFQFTFKTPNENAMISEVGHMFIRTACSWSQIEVSPGVYDYSPFDSLISDILQNSLTPVLILGGAPSFYEGGQGPTSPDAVEAYDIQFPH